MAIVGGNLADIAANAMKLQETGGSAVQSATDTGSAANELQVAVQESTASLLSKFQTIADRLNDDINRSYLMLQESDWHGNSKEQAVQIKASLQSQVGQVLGTATSNLTAEKQAFCARADELVGDIENQFKRVMGQVDVEYSRLADAARLTKENFEAADQTIRMA